MTNNSNLNYSFEENSEDNFKSNNINSIVNQMKIPANEISFEIDAYNLFLPSSYWPLIPDFELFPPPLKYPLLSSSYAELSMSYKQPTESNTGICVFAYSLHQLKEHFQFQFL